MGERKRLDSLDILKAMAILMVVVTHSLGEYKYTEVYYLFGLNMAVPIFFVVSGITNSISASKFSEVKKMYSVPRIGKQLVRFLVPIAFVYVMYMVCNYNQYTFKEFIMLFIKCGFGSGSYYYMLMLQFVFVFPILYYIMRRWETKGLVMIFLVNLAIEVVGSLVHVPTPLYRILLYRYLLYIGFGIFIYMKRNEKISEIFILCSLVFGISYIAILNSETYVAKIFTYQNWNKSSMMAAFYIAPIIYLFIRIVPNMKEGIVKQVVQLISNASYHIMCTQMMMFWYIKELYKEWNTPVVLQLVVNVGISFLSGILLYQIDQFIRSLISSKRKALVQQNNDIVS